jgi:protein O-GlcNAc transferase
MTQDLQSLYWEGIKAHDEGRFEDALTRFDALLSARPDANAIRHRRAHALIGLGRLDEAENTFAAVLTTEPDDFDALFNSTRLLHMLRRLPEALARCSHTLKMRPASVDTLNIYGALLLDTLRYQDALTIFDHALGIVPNHPDALFNRAIALRYLSRHGEAVASLETLLAAEPARRSQILPQLAQSALYACDFTRVAQLTPQVTAMAAQEAFTPMVLLGYSGDPALQRRCADLVCAALPPVARLPSPTPRRRDRIRIGYLSSDFFVHATAFLISGLLKHHDRERFEVVGIFMGPRRQDGMRARLETVFDAVHDISHRSDAEAATLLREMEIDILVDLKGHTRDARPAILAARPCPIQVAWLGYPGTMGGDFIDIIIGDAQVTPLADAALFSERIVQLPHSYQANDSERPRPPIPSRAALNLPQTGFVFCSFNNSWKITPEIFAVWMRLLAAVPSSVLWLLADNDDAVTNLRAAATASGIDAARLIFAPRAGQVEHLARQGAADLSLDTLPYNAHTTASDALWMGVPHITCKGDSFASRVGASLLAAMELPELIAGTLADYEALALALARDPARLCALKEKLSTTRASAPLFDTARFTRDLEAAFEDLWRRAPDQRT